MTRSDAQIAREWASKALGNDLLDEVPIEGYRAAARHILATTTPTMADIAWDDEVYAGLVASHYDGDLVRMIGPDLENEGAIICHWAYYDVPVTGRLLAENLTPLPGTRVDLTPRREPEPESTPDHPTELATAAEYQNAPVGTIVACNSSYPWVKSDSGLWLGCDGDEIKASRSMAFISRRVLRWGEAL